MGWAQWARWAGRIGLFNPSSSRRTQTGGQGGQGSEAAEGEDRLQLSILPVVVAGGCAVRSAPRNSLTGRWGS